MNRLPAGRICSVRRIGKARLALAAATNPRAATAGDFFVTLACVGEAEFIISAIAEALPFTFYGQATPKINYWTICAETVALIVDNFEHLLMRLTCSPLSSSGAPVAGHSRDTTAVARRVNSAVQDYPFQRFKTCLMRWRSLPQAHGAYASVPVFLQRAAGLGLVSHPLRRWRHWAHLPAGGGLQLGVELAAPWFGA
jgi:hypothetical protein